MTIDPEPIRTVLDARGTRPNTYRPARTVRIDHDDRGYTLTVTPTEAGWSEVTVTAATLVDLADAGDDLVTAVEWEQILDAGHQAGHAHYGRLLAAGWLADRLDHLSIACPDLATHSHLLGGTETDTPGRAVPGWRDRTLDLMATQLDNHAIDLAPQRTVVRDFGEPRTIGWLTTSDPHQLPLIVRVDAVGELYARIDWDRLDR